MKKFAAKYAAITEKDRNFVILVDTRVIVETSDPDYADYDCAQDSDFCMITQFKICHQVMIVRDFMVYCKSKCVIIEIG